jgi:hypothetical protein
MGGEMNSFLDYGETVTKRKRKPAVKIVRSEREAPMVLRGAEKALAERSRQMSRAKRWINAETQAFLDGPWGEQIKQIESFLKSMGLQDGEKLLDILDRLDWFRHADCNIRSYLLSSIDEAIINLRVDNGFAPIDDALPGEQLTIFQMIKEKLVEGNPNY